MKALTVQQPWAWAIIHGGKTVENRTQVWKHRGPLAIHRDICERCGSVGRDTYNEGRVAHPMYPYQRHRDVLRLLVWRCIHCQLDTVYDMRTGNLWTLDVTDYGPHGSVG